MVSELTYVSGTLGAAMTWVDSHLSPPHYARAMQSISGTSSAGITTEVVYTALEPVNDPELGIGIVPLGLVYDVEVEGENRDRVILTMTFTSPMCPVAPMIKQSVQDALDTIPGIKEGKIEITFTPPWDPRTMASDDVKVMLGIW